MKFIEPFTVFFHTLTRPFPSRDWYLSLGSTAVLGAVLIAIAVYFFIGIQSGAIIAPQGTEAPPSINISREGLQKTIGVYDVRVLNFESANYHTPDISDPSK